jgi:hypothetical protein
MTTAKQGQNRLDPLYIIFEQHLFNFQDSEVDRKTFIGNVIRDYLTHLRKLKITIPKPLEQPIVEELGVLINTMLVKKIYGCLNLSEFQQKVSPAQKRQAKVRYSRLARSKAS